VTVSDTVLLSFISAANVEQKKKKKRKRSSQAHDFEESEREIISAEVSAALDESKRSMFVQRKDLVNKGTHYDLYNPPGTALTVLVLSLSSSTDLLAFQTRHYRVGDTNGRMCFSTHQIPDVALADRNTFNWPAHVDSFSHVFMLIGLDPLYSQLNLMLLMRCSHFKDVVSIALLVKMTKITTKVKSHRLINTAEEQSPQDAIRRGLSSIQPLIDN
jgi:hypothetical protein